MRFFTVFWLFVRHVCLFSDSRKRLPLPLLAYAPSERKVSLFCLFRHQWGARAGFFPRARRCLSSARKNTNKLVVKHSQFNSARHLRVETDYGRATRAAGRWLRSVQSLWRAGGGGWRRAETASQNEEECASNGNKQEKSIWNVRVRNIPKASAHNLCRIFPNVLAFGWVA